MANFIDFIIEASKTKENQFGYEFQEELKKAQNADELQKWFKIKGYDIASQDCQKIITNKDKFYDIKATVMGDGY